MKAVCAVMFSSLDLVDEAVSVVDALSASDQTSSPAADSSGQEKSSVSTPAAESGSQPSSASPTTVLLPKLRGKHQQQKYSLPDTLLPCYSDPRPSCDHRPTSGNWHSKTPQDVLRLRLCDTHVPRCVHWQECEVRQWLRRLELPQYIHAIVEQNRIDGRRLCLLTSPANLTRIGIHDWQHIRRIVAAARKLLDVEDADEYTRQPWRPLPGPMSRGLYLLTRRPTGGEEICSEDYADFLLKHGFLQEFSDASNRRFVPRLSD